MASYGVNEMRNEWQFHVNADVLAEAALEKARYHSERMGFWSDAFDEAEKLLRQYGVDIREYSVTGGNRIELVADPGLANRYQEAQSRRAEHEHSFKEYSRWAATLAKAKGTYFLTIKDIEYFGVYDKEEINL